jgi:hypothetical protein
VSLLPTELLVTSLQEVGNRGPVDGKRFGEQDADFSRQRISRRALTPQAAAAIMNPPFGAWPSRRGCAICGECAEDVGVNKAQANAVPQLPWQRLCPDWLKANCSWKGSDRQAACQD